MVSFIPIQVRNDVDGERIETRPHEFQGDVGFLRPPIVLVLWTVNMVMVVVLDIFPVPRGEVGLGLKSHVADDERILRLVPSAAPVCALGGEQRDGHAH